MCTKYDDIDFNNDIMKDEYTGIEQDKDLFIKGYMK